MNCLLSKLCRISEPEWACCGAERREGERKEEAIFLLAGGIKSLGAVIVGRELPFGAAETGENLGNLDI